jgi:dephospho-CoA kinase
MKALVIGLAGSMGSGKSTLSNNLAYALECPRVSFGDYVRSMAKKLNKEETRSVLQELGESIIANQGWDIFCQAVLSQADYKLGGSIVVDGIRHVEALETLQRLVAPVEFALIYVSIDNSEQLARLSARSAYSPDQLKHHKEHSTERQVESILPQRAQLLVDGTKPEHEVLGQILLWLKQRS